MTAASIVVVVMVIVVAFTFMEGVRRGMADGVRYSRMYQKVDTRIGG